MILVCTVMLHLEMYCNFNIWQKKLHYNFIFNIIYSSLEMIKDALNDFE